MSEFLTGLPELREHLIKTLVEFGRSPEGASRQVADFEHAVRLAAIEETTQKAQRTAQRQIQKRSRRGLGL